jgi:hypothetical protein
VRAKLVLHAVCIVWSATLAPLFCVPNVTSNHDHGAHLPGNAHSPAHTQSRVPQGDAPTPGSAQASSALPSPSAAFEVSSLTAELPRAVVLLFPPVGERVRGTRTGGASAPLPPIWHPPRSVPQSEM